MDNKHLSETAGIKAGNLEDNLTPFKPRPRFGSGHFAFVVMLMFTFFTFPGTVYTATTTNISQSLPSRTKPRNQSNSQVRESSEKQTDKSQEEIENSLKNHKETTNSIEQETDRDKLPDWLEVVIIPLLTTVGVAFLNNNLTSDTQEKITKLNNIFRILEKALDDKKLLIDDQHVQELKRALKARAEEEKATKGNSKHGLELPEEVVEQWKKLVDDAMQKPKRNLNAG